MRCFLCGVLTANPLLSGTCLTCYLLPYHH